jgi:hypothetical protein
MNKHFRARVVLSLAAALLLGAVSPASAAKLTIVNLDTGTGAGLDDKTPVRPVGGNPGTTLGAQRLNALQQAADVWGKGLSDQIEILVSATFLPLTCDERSAFLGAAGPTVVEANFPHAPVRDTWYPVALANKLAGVDLDPPPPAGLVGDDIVAYFNSAIGGRNCLRGASWYYGYDGKVTSHEIDFVTVALHELAHGLGALSFVNLSNGQNLGPNQLNDIWNHLLVDAESGRRWSEMTDGERRLSATSGNLVWGGEMVTQDAVELQRGTNPEGKVRMFAPKQPQPGSSVSHFDLALDPETLGEPTLVRPTRDLGLLRALLEDVGWTTSLCGNATIDRNELCDQHRLNGLTCADMPGFNIGSLFCNATCDQYDTRRCFFIPPDAPLDDLHLINIPQKVYLVRKVQGGYQKHPDAIVELNRLALNNTDVNSARTGPVTGLYFTDPALVSNFDLEWEMGFPMSSVSPTLLQRLPGYSARTLPAHQVLVVDSSVDKAWFDGMRILLWLERNGYGYTPPVRMEYFPAPGTEAATSAEEEAHPVSVESTPQAANGPTRIIVQVFQLSTSPN